MPGPTRLFLLALSCALCVRGAHAIELVPGVSEEIVIPPQEEPVLIDDITFAVPAGARWAILELTTGDAEPDVDLYVRFSQAVTQEAEGLIRADHVSANPAGVDEHIFLNPASAPPLQTGRYYAALLVNTLDAEIRVTLRFSLELGGPQASFITSTFDVDDEGWTRNFPPSTLPGASFGDSDAALATDPDGFLRILDQNGPRREFAVAPPKFLGDLSRFSDPQLIYELRHTDGNLPVFRKEVRILGEGSAYAWLDDPPPAGEWEKVVVPLTRAGWTRIAGTASFEDVLRNVRRIEISMDHAAGTEVTDLDNIVFAGGPPPPPPGSGGPAHSDFESGLDGWSRNFPASPVPGASVGTSTASIVNGLGGKDSPHYMLMVDGGARDLDWVVAPPKFITNLANLDRPWYEFWFRKLEGAFPIHGVRLRLFGGGSVYEWSGARPREAWVRFRVPIDDRNWIHVFGPEDFDSMLQNVQRLEVSMDNAVGPEASGLDEFHLRLEYTPPGGRALVLNPEEIEVQVAPGDGPVQRPVEITATGAELDWSAAIEPADTSWLRLSRSVGGTPDAVNAVFDHEGLGPAIYRAEIVITPGGFLAPAKTIPVTLIVGADPRIPVLNAGGVVHAADPLVPLSAGALGSLFGEFLTDGELVTELDPASGRLPTAALGTTVRFEDSDGSVVALAPLLFLSRGQINFQTPYEVVGLSTVYVVVERDGIRSERVPVTIREAGPGVFVLPGGLAAVVNQDGRVNAVDAPAKAGEYATVYFSGAGAVDPVIASGQAAPASPLHVPVGTLAAAIGSVSAPVLGAALSPGFVGLVQLSFEIPAGLAPGQHVLTLSIAGRESNGVTFWTE